MFEMLIAIRTEFWQSYKSSSAKTEKKKRTQSKFVRVYCKPFQISIKGVVEKHVLKFNLTVWPV